MNQPHLHKDLMDEADAGMEDKDMFLHSSVLPRSNQKRLSKGIIFVLSLVISGLIVATTLYQIITPRPTSNKNVNPEIHHGKWTNCGSTVDEALARDCKFDVMGNNWVPPLCHDAAFAKDSAKGNNSFAALFGVDEFQWYEKPLLNDHIKELEAYLIAKARQGEEVTAYTTESWHIAHCMYWLSVGVNAMNRLNMGERDVWVPRVVRKPEHARHCSDITGHLFVRDSSKEDHVTPKVFFGYATCVRLA